MSSAGTERKLQDPPRECSKRKGKKGEGLAINCKKTKSPRYDPQIGDVNIKHSATQWFGDHSFHDYSNQLAFKLSLHQSERSKYIICFILINLSLFGLSLFTQHVSVCIVMGFKIKFVYDL